MTQSEPRPEERQSPAIRDVSAPEFAWRVLRLVNVYRILVSVFLLAMFLIADDPRLIGAVQPDLFFATALAYFVFGAMNDFAVTQRWPSLMSQSVVQILVDVVAIMVLTHASGGLDSGLGNLLIVSVGAVSLIWARRRAVLFGAIAAIGVLSEQYYSVLQGTTTIADSTPAGVLGSILLFISYAAHPLTRRIQESEALARQRGIDLANLSQLNDYIIQNLRESIVVVDGEDRIRLMNEAAAKYLGTDRQKRGTPLAAVSPKLMESVAAWRSGSGYDNQSPASLLSADGAILINPYFAPIGTDEQGALLIFLEDASALAEKVQQSKLASLGRLSASIAHEIRNPVGAMSHAGQLLAESPALGEEEKKLTRIIESHAQRVSGIIENVLQLSRRDMTRAERFDLAEWVRQFVAEFTATRQLPEDALAPLATSSTVEVHMDPSHLHQVVWNLCENALQYADPSTFHSPVELISGRRLANDRPFLEIRDRGPGIPEEIRDRIFEPFFRGSGEDKSGTGLGLFICRELCECNRAALVYEPRDGGGSIFRIIFADPLRWEH
ncbi:MAG: HAMP domain-containing sensor histidine kinase [Gammaproteobacteria bacterium]|jgi:two-component system sensor histidine kinase PilS (NtrC family)